MEQYASDIKQHQSPHTVYLRCFLSFMLSLFFIVFFLHMHYLSADSVWCRTSANNAPVSLHVCTKTLYQPKRQINQQVTVPSGVFTLHLYKYIYQCQCYPKGTESFHCRPDHLWARYIKCAMLQITSDWSPRSKCVRESIFLPFASGYYKHSNLTQQQTLPTQIQLCLSTKQFNIHFRHSMNIYELKVQKCQ